VALSHGAAATAHQPAEILGVSESATLGEIKKAYRRRIREYHPDHVAALGPDLRDLAERKTKEINEAHDVLSGKRKA
jgi:curved DNA-binding protein CbpA